MNEKFEFSCQTILTEKITKLKKAVFGYFTRENSNIWDFMPLKIVNFSTKTQIDYF